MIIVGSRRLNSNVLQIETRIHERRTPSATGHFDLPADGAIFKQ